MRELFFSDVEFVVGLFMICFLIIYTETVEISNSMGLKSILIPQKNISSQY